MTTRISMQSSFNFNIVNKNNNNDIFLRIDNIDLGSFETEPNSKIVVCLGSRNLYRPYSIDIPATQKKLDKVWNFKYSNFSKSSFVLALYKRKFFGQDKEIGQIEIKLDAFPINRVTKHEFVLRSPNPNAIPPKVTLSIHVCEDGSPQFKAPESDNINPRFEILPRKSYYN